MKESLIISSIAISIIFVFCLFSSFYTITPGFTVLQLRMGKAIHVHHESGLYFKLPVIDNLVYLDRRVNKAEISTDAMSRDLQTVTVDMVINYKIGDPYKLYERIGTNFIKIIIDPFTQESVKAIMAKFTAEDLIQCRHEAREKVIEDLKERLAECDIVLVDFNFIHLDFTDDFIKAVEQKQIAEQTAKQAKNLTEKIKEEANQTRTKADAEAYAFTIKRETITYELIQLKLIEAISKAIDKWNGGLPKVTTNTLPMISFDDIK